MAVTANQLIVKSECDRRGFPVAASTYLYQGTLGFLNSSGYIDDDTATGVNTFAGIVISAVDNSSGSNGDLNAEVWREGSYLLTGSGFSQATVGQRIYASDNYTISATNSASSVYIGVCDKYVSSTQVYVDITSAVTESVTADDVTLNTLTFTGATGVPEVHLTTNLADALSVEVTSVGDFFTIDTTTGAIAATLTTSAAAGLTLASHVTMGDAKNIILNSTTGSKIGTATTQKLGFYNATPVVQPSAYTQTFSTADKTHAARTATTLTVADGAGTNDGTIGTITADASVIAAVQELAAAVNALIVDLADTASVVNSVVDDLQALGLAG